MAKREKHTEFKLGNVKEMTTSETWTCVGE